KNMISLDDRDSSPWQLKMKVNSNTMNTAFGVTVLKLLWLSAPTIIIHSISEQHWALLPSNMTVRHSLLRMDGQNPPLTSRLIIPIRFLLTLIIWNMIIWMPVTNYSTISLSLQKDLV